MSPVLEATVLKMPDVDCRIQAYILIVSFNLSFIMILGKAGQVNSAVIYILVYVAKYLQFIP